MLHEKVSMVEKANTSHAHGHAILVARVGDLLVLHTSTRLSYVGNTKLGGMVNGITEREESITTDADSTGFLHKFILLFLRKWVGD